MASLDDRIREELGDWFDRLPEQWQLQFEDVALDFESVDDGAELEANEKIWPQETNQDGPASAHLFKAFQDLTPSEVRVVIFGNDPYTKLRQATGRSFEQGDLEDWLKDLPGRVSPSLKSLVCAAAGTHSGAAGYSLADTRQMIEADHSHGRRQPVWFCHAELARAVDDGNVAIQPPDQIFGYWARQGVLWLNRTLTYTKWDDEHRSSHQSLWAPFTDAAIQTLVNEARARPIVFVMWGSSADDLVPELEALAGQLGVPRRNLRTAVTGHPQWPEGYFRVGNPLTQVNYLLGPSGDPIAWA